MAGISTYVLRIADALTATALEDAATEARVRVFAERLARTEAWAPNDIAELEQIAAGVSIRPFREDLLEAVQRVAAARSSWNQTDLTAANRYLHSAACHVLGGAIGLAQSTRGDAALAHDRLLPAARRLDALLTSPLDRAAAREARDLVALLAAWFGVPVGPVDPPSRAAPYLSCLTESDAMALKGRLVVAGERVFNACVVIALADRLG